MWQTIKPNKVIIGIIDLFQIYKEIPKAKQIYREHLEKERENKVSAGSKLGQS
jgi:flagellar biosynthesis protein FliP